MVVYRLYTIYVTRGLRHCLFCTKGQCEGLTERDKQSSRFPRFFFIYPTNKTQNYYGVPGIIATQKLRPTRIRDKYMFSGTMEQVRISKRFIILIISICISLSASSQRYFSPTPKYKAQSLQDLLAPLEIYRSQYERTYSTINVLKKYIVDCLREDIDDELRRELNSVYQNLENIESNLERFGLSQGIYDGINYSKNHIQRCIKDYNNRVELARREYESTQRKAAEEAARKAAESKEWSGTGFALNKGYVATNYHIVEDAKSIKVSGINGNYYTSYTAIVVATDKVNDLAIIKINDNGFNGFGQLPYSVKMQMAEVGDDVFVLGYPLTQTMGNEIKLTNGIISSRTGFQGDPSLYQMSAPIQPGNSGGPMFDGKGNVIGIVCAHHKGTENVGYAIKTSYLKNLAESASLYNIFPSTNTVSALSLSGQVKKLRNFVYKIDCSSQVVPRSYSSSYTTSSSPHHSSNAISSYPSSNTTSSHTPKFTAHTGSKFYPSVSKCPSDLTVTRVSTSTSCTVVEILSKPDGHAWCSIDSDTYISANGTQYKLVRAEGISISPQVTYYNGYNITFRLYFPPIPSTTTQIDLVEPGSSSWKLYGIQLQ